MESYDDPQARADAEAIGRVRRLAQFWAVQQEPIWPAAVVATIREALESEQALDEQIGSSEATPGG